MSAGFVLMLVVEGNTALLGGGPITPVSGEVEAESGEIGVYFAVCDGRGDIGKVFVGADTCPRTGAPPRSIAKSVCVRPCRRMSVGPFPTVGLGDAIYV